MKNTNFQNIIVIIITTCFLSYSCTFTYKKPDTSTQAKYYYKINTYGKNRQATVIMNSGESYLVTNIYVSFDSTKWINSKSRLKEATATLKINRIEFRESFSGCVGGGLFGLVGSLITISLFTDTNKNNKNYLSFVSFFYSMSAGAIIGGVLGAVKGDKKVFIINNSSDNLDIK